MKTGRGRGIIVTVPPRATKPSPPLPKRRESDLAAPVCEYLRANGYVVRSEVRDCDITATKDDALLVVELKNGFSTDLLIQAVARQSVADCVYVALPAEGHFAGTTRFDRRRRGMETLLKRLEIGLILVHFPAADDAPPTLEVALHPVSTPKPRRKPKYRNMILREIAGRSGDYNVGGTTNVSRVTAYREEAVFLAALLETHGAQTPAALLKLGASSRTGTMLLKNVYGWFAREARGIYAAAPRALAEIERDYPHILAHHRARVTTPETL